MATSNVTADLGEQIYGLHTVDALIAAVLSLAEPHPECAEIVRVSMVARERLDAVCNNLDLISAAQSAEVQHG